MTAKHRLGPVLAFLCAFTPAAAAPGQDFAESVRTLLQLQDKIAAGHGDAAGLQRQIIARIEQRFGNGDHVPEPNERNARAALSYVLSGGPPDIGARLAGDEKTPTLMKHLLEAAVHFKRGERDAAARLLAHVDPLELPAGIGGRVALVQAMLNPDTDSAKRLALLDLAVQLMPGTLVEEAALRRAVVLAAETADMAVFWESADRYVRRFSGSLFAVEFATELVNQLVGLESKKGNPGRDRLQTLLNRLPLSGRRTAYLLLAQQATIGGAAGLAQFAARRARRLSIDGAAEWQRAELYDAVHGIAGDGYERSLDKLRRLDPEVLAASDRDLLFASLAIAGRIRATGPASERQSPAATPDDLPAAHQSLITRSDRSLKAADALIASLQTDASQD
jgi:chemotaxis protein MotC